MRRRALIFMLILVPLAVAGLAAPYPVTPYRALQVYTISAPDAKDPGRIVARTSFVNRGKAQMSVQARLAACLAIGFAGGTFAARIEPDKEAIWRWTFTPPPTLQREILTGSITINGKPERDLYLAVQGPDQADFDDPGAEKITERGRVVATYAPRKQTSIDAELAYQVAQGLKPVLTLAAKGKTAYTIVVEALPAPAAGKDALAGWTAAKLTAPEQDLVAAVADLRDYTKRLSDAELPILTNTAGPAIRLRVVDLGQAAKGLHDAYRLKTSGKDILIEGANLDGLRNGIYGLLTDNMGCHWYAPRQLGEEIAIPKDKTVRLPALNEVCGSRWFSSSGVTWGYDALWDRRSRTLINRGQMNFGHSWYGYINNGEFPYDKFPDYYARDREGKIRKFDSDWSSTNFCSTNPDVIEIVAKKVNAYFAANPDAPVCSLDPNDYGPMCLCDRCLALDKALGQTNEDGTDVTDRLLYFSQQIYDRLDPKYKDKYLGILIYGYQMELPKSVKPHAHHAGTICNFTPRYDFSRPWTDPSSAVNRDFYQLVKGWGGMLTQFGYYDYYDHYWFFGPFGIIHKMREDMPAFRELGGTFIVLEADANFGIQGISNYISGRLIWDLDADTDLLMEDYFRQYYGPAAAPMRKFFLTSEKYYALERPGKGTETLVARRPEFWTELDGYLKDAEKAVANLPAEKKRFADRIQLNRDGFEYGHLIYQYDLQFGRIAGKHSAIDHAAAVKFLQDHRADIEGRLKKYPLDSPYWPALLPYYSQMNVDAEIKTHQDALQANAGEKAK